MKTRAIALLLALLIPTMALAQVEVTVDPTEITFGFMNVYFLDGTPAFASGWGLPDLTAVFDGPNLILGPNTIGDPDPYWYIGGGGPGAAGNKIMEANSYAEVTGPYAGQTVTFSGEILANSLTEAHTVIAFIKDFAPDYSSFETSFVPLTGPGSFSVSLLAINDPGRHVQYGFQMVGVNVWVTDVEPFGTMTVGPDPTVVASEPMSFGNVKALYR